MKSSSACSGSSTPQEPLSGSMLWMNGRCASTVGLTLRHDNHADRPAAADHGPRPHPAVGQRTPMSYILHTRS